MSVSWTALLCLVKINNGVNDIDIDEIWIYIGWLVIGLISICLSVRIEYDEQKAWKNLVQESGLLNAAMETRKLFNGLLLKNAINKSNLKSLHTFESDLLSARSATNVVRLLLKLEGSISVDRFDLNWFSTRYIWVEKLHFIKDEAVVSPSTSYNNHHNNHNHNAYSVAGSIDYSSPLSSPYCVYVSPEGIPCQFYGSRTSRYCSTHALITTLASGNHATTTTLTTPFTPFTPFTTRTPTIDNRATRSNSIIMEEEDETTQHDRNLNESVIISGHNDIESNSNSNIATQPNNDHDHTPAVAVSSNFKQLLDSVESLGKAIRPQSASIGLSRSLFTILMRRYHSIL